MAAEVKTRLTPADIEKMVASGELSQDEFWEFVNGITLDAIAPGFRCRVSELFPED